MQDVAHKHIINEMPSLTYC